MNRRPAFATLRSLTNLTGLALATLFGASPALPAQTVREVSPEENVRLVATVQESPPAVTLEFVPVVEDTTGFVIRRREAVGQPFVEIGRVDTIDGPEDYTFTDTSIVTGRQYHYQVIREYSGDSRPPDQDGPNYFNNPVGHIVAGIDRPAVEARGHAILVVENTLATPLADELALLRQDLIGDGWRVHRIDAPRHVPYPTANNDNEIPVEERIAPEDHPASAIREQIQALHASAPDAHWSVLLVGKVQIPYSGAVAPDGHSNHFGAWPADAYYGDVDGVWTDDTAVVSNNAERTRNYPGDGKFDQDTHNGLELAVGRIAMYDLPAYALDGESAADREIRLMRRFLQRNHRYRHGLVEAPLRSIIDSGFYGFGSFSTEPNVAFRSFPSLFGANDPREFERPPTGPGLGGKLRQEPFVWAYVSGGGNYRGITAFEDQGIQSDAIAEDALQAVFMPFFGSYHGDWDVDDALMRAFVAQQTHGMATFWGGRPITSYWLMSSGRSIGFAFRETLNSLSDNRYMLDWGDASPEDPGIWMTILGDPTTHMFPVQPPASLQQVEGNGERTLAWQPSSDPDLIGYHLYKGPDGDGPFTRLNTAPLATESFTDTTPAAGEVYKVRAVARRAVHGGSVRVLSQGIFSAAPDVANAPPFVRLPENLVIEDGLSASLAPEQVRDDGLPDPGTGLTYLWEIVETPDGASATLTSPANPTTDLSVSREGTYRFRLSASDGEATGDATVTVSFNLGEPPVVNAGRNILEFGSLSVTLEGQVSDDGLPNPPGTVTTSWSLLNGPGTATFTDAGAPQTPVSFSAAGTYRLRLSADDGASTATDDVTVTVSSEAPGTFPTEGLVTYLPFDPGAGTLTANLADPENPGEVLGGAAIDTGEPDAPHGSSVFIGQNDTGRVTVQLPDIETFSLGMWFRIGDLTGAPSTNHNFFQLNGFAMNVDFTTFGTHFMQRTFDGGFPQIKWSRSNQILSDNQGEWMHLLLTYDSTSIQNDPKLYLNGIEYPVNLDEGFGRTNAEMGALDAALSGIGNTSSHPYNRPLYNSSVDEFRVYDRILTPAQARALAAETPGQVRTLIKQSALQADPVLDPGTVRFDVTFGEPVSGFEASDVQTGGTATASTIEVRERAPYDGASYEIAASGFSSEGTFSVNIPAGAASGASGPNGPAIVLDNAVTLVLSTGTAAPQPLGAEMADALMLDRVRVRFDRALDPQTALNPDNYSLSGGATVLLPTLDETGTEVLLEVAGLLGGTGYTLTLNALEGLDGKAIADGTTVPFATPADSLLVYYNFEEGPSSTLIDRASGFDAALTGGEWVGSSDGAGQALRLDNSGSGTDFGEPNAELARTVAAATALNGLDGITIAAQIRPERDSFYTGGIVSGIEPSSSNPDPTGLFLGTDGFNSVTDADTMFSAALEVDGQLLRVDGLEDSARTTDWEHLAMSWASGGPLELFLNGTRQPTSLQSAPATGTVTGVDELAIGFGNQEFSGWEGAIDELRIYGRKLTDEEMASVTESVRESGARPYTLATGATGGWVEREPARSAYADGEEVTLTAFAGPGQAFTGWSGDASGTDNPLSVTMNADTAVTANFAPAPEQIPVTLEQAAGQADPAIEPAQVRFRLDFGRPVTGLTASDVVLDTEVDGITPSIQELAPNNGTAFELVLSGFTSSGTITAQLPAGAVSDTAGLGLTNQAAASLDATVLVLTNLTDEPPQVLSAEALDADTVRVSFEAPLDPASAENPGNYSLSPFSQIFGATLQDDYTTVLLEADLISSGARDFELTVSGVASFQGDVMPAPQTVSFVADSLLLYYRFDESSGTSAADATGTYPATVSAPDWRPGEGQVDGALYFDGTGSTYIEQTGAVVDALNGLEGITVSVWVRSEVTSTDKGIFTSINPNGQGEHLNLRYDKSGFFTGRDNVIQAGVNTDDPAGGTAGESSASAQVTGWQHLAMTWESGGVLRLFIDGVEDTGFSPQGVRNGTLTGITRLLIGKGPKANDPGVDGWSGWIDEFRIYSDPLRPEQIAAIHTEATQMTYTLQLDASGGGTVTRSPALSSYPGGTSVSLSAVADTGYLFSGWSGDLSGTANPASLVMDADKAVTAAFAPDLNSFEGRMIDLGKPVDPALDDDNDGAEALLEYALNRDLTRADPGNNPQTGMENGRMTLSFERVPARDDVTITVERAPALPAGAEDWTAIARSENGGPMVNLGAHEVREFGSELVSVTIVLDNEPDEGFVRIRVTRENP